MTFRRDYCIFLKRICIITFDSGNAADGIFNTSDIVNVSITSLTHNFNPCKYYETSNFSSISSNSNSLVLY